MYMYMKIDKLIKKKKNIWVTNKHAKYRPKKKKKIACLPTLLDK